MPSPTKSPSSDVSSSKVMTTNSSKRLAISLASLSLTGGGSSGCGGNGSASGRTHRWRVMVLGHQSCGKSGRSLSHCQFHRHINEMTSGCIDGDHILNYSFYTWINVHQEEEEEDNCWFKTVCPHPHPRPQKWSKQLSISCCRLHHVTHECSWCCCCVYIKSRM